MPRVVLCLAGVVGRSIRRTWPSIQARVVQPLKANGMTPAIYVFNNDVGDALVDGVHINASDIQLVPATHFESGLQAELLREMRRRCHERNRQRKANASRICTLYGHSGRMHDNAMAQLYSEWRASLFLQHHVLDYDVAIFISPDFYLALNVSVADVVDASRSLQSVYTTVVNDAGNGFTDGLYIGSLVPLSRLLSRLEDDATWMVYERFHYEALLKAAFVRHRLTRYVTPMVFFKLRANGGVSWPTLGHPGRSQAAPRAESLAGASEREAVLRQYYRLCSPDSGFCSAKLQCGRLVEAVDPSPIRSPQAVHDFLVGHHFAGRALVELGTRNGDGINCFARVTASAVAVERDGDYCTKLEKRAQTLRASGEGSYGVVCQSYLDSTPDADVYTWWQQGDGFSNENILGHLSQLHRARRIRSYAQAVLLFDHKWRHDMESLERLRPLCSQLDEVTFDETALCKSLHGPQCHRSSGAFTVGMIKIADVTRQARWPPRP